MAHPIFPSLKRVIGFYWCRLKKTVLRALWITSKSLGFHQAKTCREIVQTAQHNSLVVVILNRYATLFCVRHARLGGRPYDSLGRSPGPNASAVTDSLVMILSSDQLMLNWNKNDTFLKIRYVFTELSD